jgi:hypothetical protein
MSGIGHPPTSGNFSATRDVQLRIIYTILDEVSEIENREDGYVVEMAQQMLADLIYEGDINDPMTYIRHYLGTSMEESEMDEFLAKVNRRVQEGS